MQTKAAPVNAPTQILAIRHGETDWNCSGRYQGQTDIALNAQGLAQALQTAQALADEDLAAIYTSDLARAQQTAQRLADVKCLPLQIEPALREQHFGVFQGLRADEIALRWPEAHACWHRREPDFGPEGGESRRAFHRRCLTAIERQAAQHPGQTIAIVCHGGVLDCLYRAATGLALDAPRSWALENAAISRLRYDASGFAILAWGLTEHLSGAQRDELPELFPAP
ncbi:histidine phosphatase family protein [Paucibacter sp. KBW04]|uniref:histidine phosphatase family protein n=1 Tax=Paucibacter sp. KBW04 TaxID=2153361 RepID=UPI001E59842D|nr:histidine phosphatase family protein [Paucibacter sp. KBW04]